MAFSFDDWAQSCAAGHSTRFMSPKHRGGGPDTESVRAARSNLRYHLRYIGHLIRARNWLAGDRLTYADLAAAAHLTCLDYLGDVQGTRTKPPGSGTRG